jgi:23S rRNA (cytidine1920-2'-O)/16S rRNA (cytidine1409-2'-O)-methyltransferase
MPEPDGTKPKKDRIDKLLVERGLAESRTKAQALVLAGLVLADEKRIEKPSEYVSENSVIRLKGSGPESKYASRAGLKLEKALYEFHIDPTGLICLDIGSSTGGFTDCLLRHGAAKVVAVDSGTNQMIWRLRNDASVDLRENTNARKLAANDFNERFDLCVIDVSFISIKKILPAIVPLSKESGEIVLLIKPQFEVGRGEVGKRGIVRDSELHKRVVKEINEFAADLSLSCQDVIDSPILGAEGNKEFLAHYVRT